MPMPKALLEIVKHLDLIKWEAFAVAAVVWAAAVRPSGQPIDQLVIAIVTACMWLIAGDKADVHLVVTLNKTFITGEHSLFQGISRMAGQVGGGILGALICIIIDKNSNLQGMDDSYGSKDFTRFLNEGIAASIILLVFNRIEKTEADEVAAFGFAAILYAMGRWSNNPARVIGPQLLQKGGPEDDFALAWFGPLLGAPGYGLLQLLLTGEMPKAFAKFPCFKKCAKSDDAAEDNSKTNDALVENP